MPERTKVTYVTIRIINLFKLFTFMIYNLYPHFVVNTIEGEGKEGHVSIVFHTKDFTPAIDSIIPFPMQRALDNPDHRLPSPGQLKFAFNSTICVEENKKFSFIAPPTM